VGSEPHQTDLEAGVESGQPPGEQPGHSVRQGAPDAELVAEVKYSDSIGGGHIPPWRSPMARATVKPRRRGRCCRAGPSREMAGSGRGLAPCSVCVTAGVTSLSPEGGVKSRSMMEGRPTSTSGRGSGESWLEPRRGFASAYLGRARQLEAHDATADHAERDGPATSSSFKLE